MLKSNPIKQDERGAGKRRALVSISLVLSLVVTGVALANLGSFGPAAQKHNQKQSGEVAIEIVIPAPPSKEYVYAGGRLVATEEGCGYSISPTSAFYSQQGSEGLVNLTADAGCTWTVSASDPDWLTITSATSGSGSDVISYLVRDNDTRSARQGTLTIADLSFTVTQDGGLGSDCTYAISPQSVTFGPSGGSGSVSVFTDERCAWRAISDANWVTETSGCCGVGNGTLSYTVGVNTTGIGRNATITIGDKTFSVKQKAG